VSQEASIEGMVGEVGCKRKKKKVRRIERKQFAVVVLPLMRI
jgi:hypothetical protein